MNQIKHKKSKHVTQSEYDQQHEYNISENYISRDRE